MAKEFNRGDHIFIPFIEGKTVTDSQLMPRMYKTREAFQKYFPGGYVKRDSVELAEFAEVVHGRWEKKPDGYFDLVDLKCSVCGAELCFEDDEIIPTYNYCPTCGAIMEE